MHREAATFAFSSHFPDQLSRHSRQPFSFFMIYPSQFSLTPLPNRRPKSLRLRSVVPVFAVLVAGGALVAPPALAQAQTLPPPSKAVLGADYRLGVGDELQVTVSNHPDVDSALVVRPDGKITLPRAGELVAAGKTASRLSAEIERILARTLNNARVRVIVKAAAARQARIMGAVKAPSAYNVKPNTRVVDLISMAGGPDTKLSRISGRLIRGSNVYPFDVQAAIGNPTGKSNIAIFPDDLVQLEARDFVKQLTVTGNVAAPGAFDLNENLSVTQLLAQAGGPSAGAALKRAYVLRAGAPVPLDLTDVESNRISPNSPLNTFKFQPGDVLVVPENTDRVNIMGQVARPASYPLSEDAGQTTVLSLLSAAGGPTESANLSDVTLTRMIKGEPVNTTINVKAMRQGSAPDNVFLRPDDALFVPKQDATVSVIGPVGAPGSYPLIEGETLLGLLAKTGNPSKDAGLRNSYVLRDGTQIPIDLRPTLIEGAIDPKIANFRLQRGDVVVIPDISEQVTVTGAIARPGPYSLSDDLTIVSLLARAGNPTADASKSKAYILRQGVRIPLDLNVFSSGATDQPSLTGFRLKAGDTLVIPENKIFYTVVGQVNAPGSFPYPDKPSEATVLRAVVNAGGAAGRANLKDAGILREVGAEVKVIPVNLQLLFNNKQRDNEGNNIVLQPRDILYVPQKGQGFNVSQALGLALGARALGGF